MTYTQKDKIKFIVYSDIHHDELAAKCLNLQDTLTIEAEVHQRCAEGDFDFTLFCGDRFMKREPIDEVKTKVDANLVSAINYNKKPHYSLIGNHDCVDNSLRWHTSNTLNYSPYVVVMDQSKTYVNDDLNLCIHAMPFGFNFPADYQVNKDHLNIFAFHDMIKGNYTLEDREYTFAQGIDRALIDSSDWQLALGGHMHVPQRFAFQKTRGGYIGACLQRTMADANRDRGWFEIEATRGPNGWSISSMEMVLTRPFFCSYSFDVDERTTFHDLKIDESEVGDCKVEVKLRGKKADVDRLAEEPWQNYVTFCGARSIEVSRNYVAEANVLVVDMSKSNSLQDDLDLYLQSGFVELGIIQKEGLTSLLKTWM